MQIQTAEKQAKKWTSFWTYSRRFPPPLVRVLAKRSQCVPKSCEEIAHASGLDIYQVRFIATRRSWDEVAFGDMRKFCLACGVDFEDPIAMHRATEYLRKNTRWSYLKRSQDWKSVYEPLCLLFQSIDP